MVSPVENAVIVPARAAYSHSASVSNRYLSPVRLNSQIKYCCTSSHDTPIIGCRALPHPRSFGEYSQPPAVTHESHSSNVVSYLATAKYACIVTLCCGPSLIDRPISFVGEPSMTCPPPTTTISGHSAQSLKTSLYLRQRSSRPTRTSRVSHGASANTSRSGTIGVGATGRSLRRGAAFSVCEIVVIPGRSSAAIFLASGFRDVPSAPVWTACVGSPFKVHQTYWMRPMANPNHIKAPKRSHGRCSITTHNELARLVYSILLMLPRV